MELWVWFRKRAVLIFQQYILKYNMDEMMQDWGLASKWSGAGKRTAVHGGNAISYKLVTVEAEGSICEGLRYLALFFHVCVAFSPIRSFKRFHGVTWADEEIHRHSSPDRQLRPGVQGTGVQDRRPAWREAAPGAGAQHSGALGGGRRSCKEDKDATREGGRRPLAQCWVPSANCSPSPEMGGKRLSLNTIEIILG